MLRTQNALVRAHHLKNSEGPPVTILKMNIKSLIASEMIILQHLACTTSERLVIANYKLRVFSKQEVQPCQLQPLCWRTPFTKSWELCIGVEGHQALVYSN